LFHSAEAHKAKVEQHLYQNVQLREKPKPAATTSSKPTDQTAPSDAEYSVVSQDWIKKKKKSTVPESNSDNTDTIPPPLPPRSEFSDQLDEDKFDEGMYDLPLVPKDVVKVATSDNKSTSSSSVTMDNDLYQSSTAKVKAISSPEKKPAGSAQVKKAVSLSTSEATYDVVGDAPTNKALTLPSTTRRSASPEYAVVQQSPKRTHTNPNLTSPTNKSPLSSPILPRAPPSAREYDYISVGSSKEAAPKVTVSESSAEYDLLVTAQQNELRINSPPSPQLSHYAKLQDTKAGKKTDKQQWDLPKKSSKTSKKTRAVSVEAPQTGSETSDSVDEVIKELEKGLEGSNARNSKSKSLYLSDTDPSGNLSLDWDHSDMQKKHKSPTTEVQKSWVEKHNKILIQRSYEDVDLPNNGSPTVPDKLRRGWSPRGVDKDDGEKLPAGWSKVVGEDGVYYWHVKSGRTQWKPPKEGDASKVCTFN